MGTISSAHIGDLCRNLEISSGGTLWPDESDSAMRSFHRWGMTSFNVIVRLRPARQGLGLPRQARLFENRRRTFADPKDAELPAAKGKYRTQGLRAKC